MKILSQYLFSTVFKSIAGVLFVVVALDVVAAVIDQVGDLNGEYTFVEALRYVGTSLPGRIYRNVPLSSLIGCLIGLGVLANSSELIVMRAAGVSLVQIVGFVLRPVLLFIVGAALLGEYAVPYAEQQAEGRRAMLLGKEDRMASVSGLWSREENEFIHINAVFPDGDMFGVSRYRFDSRGELTEVSFARKVRYRGDSWLEKDVAVTRFDGDNTSTEKIDRRLWLSGISPDLLRLVQMEPESLPISDLYSYANYLEAQGQQAGNHWLAFWGKLLQPFTTVSLVLIAVSFIFGPLRESTTGTRIFVGVVTGIVFSTSRDLLGPASLVYGFSEFWAVLAPTLVSLVVGLLLLRRAA